MNRSFIFLVILLLFSCTKSVEIDDLSSNQSKWNSQNIVSYEFTLTINCFCPSERVGPHVIKVVNDQIVSVNNLPYDPGTTGELMTIDQLFSFVERSIKSNPYTKSIEYNSTYGYPQSVYFDFYQSMADEEIGYKITDFKEI
jgi:hypothetical protein